MKTTLYLLGLCMLFSCAAKTDQHDLKSEIESANKEWMDAMAKKDADAVAAMYTEDAKFMAPNAPGTTGREAIKKFVTATSGISAIRLTTEEVEGTGDLAIESGKYEIMVADNMVVDHGKYLVQWKKNGGKWLLDKDIFNSDLPGARAMAQKDQPVAVALYKVKKGQAQAFEDFARNVLMPATDRSTPEKDQIMRAVRLLSPANPEKDGTTRYMWVFDPYAEGGHYDIEAILVAKHGKEKGKELMKQFSTLTTGYDFYVMKQTDI
jgi:uncharacterized protein (TIGR02246 family)